MGYRSRTDAQVALLTGSALISQLKSTGKALISQGEVSGSSLITQMGQQLQTLAAQLKSTLADQVTKPINDLSDNLKIQAERAIATLRQSEAFIDSVIGCSKQDIEQLSTAAEASIRQFASDTVPWVPDFPYITRVTTGGGAALLGARVSWFQIYGTDDKGSQSSRPSMRHTFGFASKDGWPENRSQYNIQRPRKY
jgi:hypothetical protein